MSLLEGLKSLLAARVSHQDAIAAIDRELADVRVALGLPATDAPVVAAYQAIVLRCERCGEPFTPAAAVSGRWCSRRCYEGMPVDERRALILAALKEAGGSPVYAAALRTGPLAGVSNGTIHNDLGSLRRQGIVENTDNGWQLARAEQDEPAQETAVPDPPEAPFVQPPSSLN